MLLDLNFSSFFFLLKMIIELKNSKNNFFSPILKFGTSNAENLNLS